MLSRSRERGFSLLNIVIAFGAIIVMVWIYKAWLARQERQANAKAAQEQANLIRDRLLDVMKQEIAWRATLSSPQNATTLACLLQHTNCLGKDGAPFVLRDNLNRQVYDATVPTNGFNPEGYTCSTYSDAGNDNCPFRVDLKWKGDCDDECVDPRTVTLTGKLRFHAGQNGPFAGITLKDQEFKATVRVRPDEPRTCYDLLQGGRNHDGLYSLKLSADSVPVTVYCDQSRDGGGWALAVSAAGTNYRELPESGALSLGATGRMPPATIRAYLDASGFHDRNNLRLELPDIDGGIVIGASTGGDADADAFTTHMPKAGDCRSVNDARNEAAHKPGSGLSLFFSSTGMGELGLDETPPGTDAFQGFRICFGTTKLGRNCGIGCNRKWTGDLTRQKGMIWIR